MGTSWRGQQLVSSVLSYVGGVALKAVQDLAMLATGTETPPSLEAGGLITNAMAWLAIGIVLIPIGFLAGYMTRFFAIFLWVATIGVFMIAAADFGVVGHAVASAGGYLVFILAIWFLYMGIGELVNGVLRRTVVPLGAPLFKRKAAPQA